MFTLTNIWEIHYSIPKLMDKRFTSAQNLFLRESLKELHRIPAGITKYPSKPIDLCKYEYYNCLQLD